jgi:tetratricopeptide (TPR) repeat protein
MLPARSTRYAGLDGEIPRLHLVSNVQLVLIALIMLALFWLLFSPQFLITKLYAQDRYDGLTWAYLENLHHSEPHQADVAILLARALQNESTAEDLEERLSEFADSTDPRQRHEVRLILLTAYQRTLLENLRAARESAILSHMRAIVRSASTERISDASMAHLLANAALTVGEYTLAVHFLQQIEPQLDPAETLAAFGKQTLAAGEFETAAHCYFAARHLAPSKNIARKWFQLGIDALMANSLFERAMDSAEREIGDLQDDPQTLRYLVKSARAAGYPDLAAQYAWALVAPHQVVAPL